MPEDSWSAEQVELLRRLWRQGETSAVIAARLGGVSRSAVMGKIFRLRLRAESAIVAAAGSRQRAATAAGDPTIMPVRRRRRPRSKQPPPPPPIHQHKTLFELTNITCRSNFWAAGPKKTGKSVTAGMRKAGRRSPCSRKSSTGMSPP